MEYDRLIPLMKPLLPTAEEVLPRLQRMDESGWYSNYGPQAIELEHRFAALLNVAPEQVMTASSATSGLQGTLATSPTESWTVPSWTFAATVGAGLNAGKELEFVDIDPDTWWAEGANPSRIVTSPFGAWKEDVISTDDEVVVDAAATLGKMPTLANIGPKTAVVFSLGATKVLGSGEGGIVAFGDPERAEEFRNWTRHGFKSDRIAHSVGANARLSEITAAYAHTALDGWPREREEWKRAKSHAEEVQSAAGLDPAPVATTDPTPYWIVLFPTRKARNTAEDILKSKGIASRRWWELGCHTMPGYDVVLQPDLPHTEDAADRYLGLPMYRGFGEAEAERVYEALRDIRKATGAW